MRRLELLALIAYEYVLLYLPVWGLHIRVLRPI